MSLITFVSLPNAVPISKPIYTPGAQRYVPCRAVLDVQLMVRDALTRLSHLSHVPTACLGIKALDTDVVLS